MSWAERWRGWLRHDTHPAIQFVKYAMAGGLATAVDMVAFFLLAWLVFPALKADEGLVSLLGLRVEPIDTAVRVRNFWIDSGIAFFFSNLTAYVANVLWVFKPGRHSRHLEIALFFAVSLTSVLIGTLAGSMMIAWFDLSTGFSYVTKMLASLMVNYAGRKFFVFKG